MTGEHIAAAFMAHNDRVTWQARCIPQPTGDIVYFTSTSGLVSLEYDVGAARWEVKFSKVQAKWGDYTGSVARSFFAILSTLKAAGLPFDAPASLVGTVIETQLGDGGRVFVSWREAHTKSIWDSTAWPVKYAGTASQVLRQSRAAAPGAQAKHEELITAGYIWDGMDGYMAPDVAMIGAANPLLNDPRPYGLDAPEPPIDMDAVKPGSYIKPPM